MGFSSFWFLGMKGREGEGKGGSGGGEPDEGDMV